MTKRVQRAAIESCPLHAQIRDAALKALELHGRFSMIGLLHDLRMAIEPEAIRWDYLRDSLQEVEGCVLVPVTAAYFRPHKRAEEVHRPDKFLAGGGHGKRAAGFASVVSQNDHLVLAKVQRMRRIAEGVVKNYVGDRTAIVERRGTYLPPSDAGKGLPPPDDSLSL